MHAPTLLLSTIAVTVLAGGLFGMLWLQTRREASYYGLWMLAHLLGTVGCVLLVLRTQIPGWLSIAVANALVCFGYAVLWAGLRRFHNRPALPFWTIFGAIAWLIACSEPAIYDSVTARVIVLSLVVAGYSFATAVEAWRGWRAEALRADLGAVVVHGIHGFVFLLRIPNVLFFPLEMQNGIPFSPTFALLTFEGMVNIIVIGYLYMILAKERAKVRLTAAAAVDGLTGIANRGAFVDATVAAMRRRRRGGVLLIADLDHFKRINDRFGHLAGDRALVEFCAVARREIPVGALIGRLGGEEFGIFLPAADPAAGRAVGERLRAAVAAASIVHSGERLPVSVSIGFAECGPDGDFDTLFAAADGALYAAKSLGRDRVVSSLERGAITVPAADEPAPSVVTPFARAS